MRKTWNSVEKVRKFAAVAPSEVMAELTGAQVLRGYFSVDECWQRWVCEIEIVIASPRIYKSIVVTR